ncbi:MAG TPA: DUF4058 family protein [Pirellulales bacterium]|nr:DUF4058 family protein [Pirellulales bacterium]
MTIHDWTRVDAGIFHHFHQNWVPEISRSLNAGRLPPDYYALVEQVSGGRWPDVLTLQAPPRRSTLPEPRGGLMLDDAPPQVQFRQKAEGDLYAAKASAVVIRHVSGHEVVAIVEVVSPGNKSSRSRLDEFVGKAVEILRAGIHLLIVDLFPPGPRDPEGIHKAIWDEFIENDFALPAGKPLTLAAYAAGDYPEAFVEPLAVGDRLPDMPLFLSSEIYVPVPLEATYQPAWEAMPTYWREFLEA